MFSSIFFLTWKYFIYHLWTKSSNFAMRKISNDTNFQRKLTSSSKQISAKNYTENPHVNFPFSKAIGDAKLYTLQYKMSPKTLNQFHTAVRDYNNIIVIRHPIHRYSMSINSWPISIFFKDYCQDLKGL